MRVFLPFLSGFNVLLNYEVIIMNNLVEVWLKVFPHSHATLKPKPLSKDEDSYFFTGYLFLPNEWANKISHNDPLSYMVDVEGNRLVELQLSVTVAPDSPYYAYGSQKMRKSSFDISKAEDRFIKIHKWLESLTELYHNNHKELIMVKLKG